MPSLRFNPNDWIINIDAKLTGKTVLTARMVFDTGASLVIVPWKLATGLGLSIDPTRTLETTTATSVETAPLVTIPAISVMGLTVKNVTALVKDLPAEAGVDGLLGLSFIKHFRVKINFKKGILEMVGLPA